MSDLRPANCRFRLQDEGKPFPRSSCTACKKTIVSGLGKECSFLNGRILRYRMEVVGEASDSYIDHVEDENGAWVMFEALSTARAEGKREGLEEAAKYHDEQAEYVMGQLHCGSENWEYRAAGKAADAHKAHAAAIRAKIEETRALEADG